MSIHSSKTEPMNPLVTNFLRTNFTTPEQRQDSINFLKNLSAINKKSESIRHSITLMYSADTCLKPTEMFNYVLEIANVAIPDENVFKVAINIVRNLCDNKGIDLKSKILNSGTEFPVDSLARGIVIECLKFPPSKEFYKFIFESTLSSLPLVRRCFLKFAKSLMSVEIDKDLREKIEEILVQMGNDSSYLVIKEWFDPAFYFLQNNSHFPNILKGLLHSHKDFKFKVLIGLNLERVYNICHDSISLFKDQDIRVVTAAICGIGNIEIDDISIKQALLNQNPIIRSMAIKSIKVLPKDLIDEYIKDPSTETRTSLILYFQSHQNSEKYIKMLLNEYNQENNEYSWRICFELLSFKPEILLSIGDSVFDLAEKCSTRHPPKLMKKALEIIDYFSRKNNNYRQRAELLLSKLESSNSIFQQKAGKILRQLKAK